MKAWSRDDVKEKIQKKKKKKRRKETEESSWATEEWRDVGTLEMRRGRKSGQVRWKVNSVGHMNGLEMGKVSGRKILGSSFYIITHFVCFIYKKAITNYFLITIRIIYLLFYIYIYI